MFITYGVTQSGWEYSTQPLSGVDVANNALSIYEHSVNNVTIQHLSPVSEDSLGIQGVRMTQVSASMSTKQENSLWGEPEALISSSIGAIDSNNAESLLVSRLKQDTHWLKLLIMMEPHWLIPLFWNLRLLWQNFGVSKTLRLLFTWVEITSTSYFNRELNWEIILWRANNQYFRVLQYRF